MDIKESFLKIVSKAESNGFSFRDNSEIDNLDYIGMGRFDMSLTTTHEKDGDPIEEKSKLVFNIYEIFFNHNFAKTFFGTNEVCEKCGKQLKGEDWKAGNCSSCKESLNEKKQMESWQFHLREMVVKEDLIKYLIKYVG